MLDELQGAYSLVGDERSRARFDAERKAAAAQEPEPPSEDWIAEPVNEDWVAEPVAVVDTPPRAASVAQRSSRPMWAWPLLALALPMTLSWRTAGRVVASTRGEPWWWWFAGLAGGLLAGFLLFVFADQTNSGPVDLAVVAFDAWCLVTRLLAGVRAIAGWVRR